MVMLLYRLLTEVLAENLFFDERGKVSSDIFDDDTFIDKNKNSPMTSFTRSYVKIIQLYAIAKYVSQNLTSIVPSVT